MEISWTDDIPVCQNTGVGSASNEIYRKDGNRFEMHPFEDRSFRYNVDVDVGLYGIIDGFSGPSVADFAAKKLPAELLLGQVTNTSSDDAIKDVLRQAFMSVDREYFESISEHLASRVVLRIEAIKPDDPTLALLDATTMTGASATVGLLVDNARLFVANVGDTHAVVARQLGDGQLRAIPLTVEHNVDNEDEALRLCHLNLDVASLGNAFAPQGYTRCLGCHRVKGGYKEVNGLKNATDEPVLSEPEISGPLRIDSSHLFLLIYSRPLSRALEEILNVNSGFGHVTSKPSSSSQPNVASELCSLVRDHFSDNTTVTGVAQSVVDKIVRKHREILEQPDHENLSTTCRDDMSLLVRNFNAKFASQSKSKQPFSSSVSNATVTLTNQESIGIGINRFGRTTRSSTTTESSDVLLKPDRELSVDANGRVKAYVEFSHFHQEWHKFKNSTSPGATPPKATATTSDEQTKL